MSATPNHTDPPARLILLSVIITLVLTATGDAGRPVSAEVESRLAPTRVDLPSGPTMTPCAGCHAVDPLFSHPVDVVPPMHVPLHLPLPGGRMTCSTCHDTRIESHREARRVSTALLRQPTETLCAECHDAFGTSRAAMHATLRRGHRDPLTFRPRPRDNDCLSCHDGSVATDADGPFSWLEPADRFRSSHPVHVEYLPGSVTGDVGLRPIDEIDRRVRLFEGRISCGSCHSVFSRRDDLLVMTNDASRLCLTCHSFQRAGSRTLMTSHD